MFDIGIGELVLLAAVGLFIFGPDRLPKAAADAGRWLRQLRGMAANARQDLAESAGVDLTETLDAVKELREMHPRRIATSFLNDTDTKPSGAPAPATPAKPGATTPDFDPDAT